MNPLGSPGRSGGSGKEKLECIRKVAGPLLGGLRSVTCKPQLKRRGTHLSTEWSKREPRGEASMQRPRNLPRPPQRVSGVWGISSRVNSRLKYVQRCCGEHLQCRCYPNAGPAQGWCGVGAVYCREDNRTARSGQEILSAATRMPSQFPSPLSTMRSMTMVIGLVTGRLNILLSYPKTRTRPASRNAEI